MQINLVKFLNNLNKYIGFGNSTTLRNLSIFDELRGGWMRIQLNHSGFQDFKFLSIVKQRKPKRELLHLFQGTFGGEGRKGKVIQ